MQIDVSQTGYDQESSQAQPVCADLDGSGFCGVQGSNLFELPKSASRFEAVNEARLDEGLVLEAGSLQIMLGDSANFSAARGWGRPGNELLVAGNYGETEFGFEAFDGGPICFEDAQWVDDNDLLGVVNDSRVDEKNPNREIDGGNCAEQTWKVTPGASNNGWDDARQGYESSADSGVKADLGSDGVHVSNYPYEIFTSTKDARGN